ncbi:MAG: hypothetical protein ABI721_03815 [Candidatus Dojkabacteria bacterium]
MANSYQKDGGADEYLLKDNNVPMLYKYFPGVIGLKSRIAELIPDPEQIGLFETRGHLLLQKMNKLQLVILSELINFYEKNPDFIIKIENPLEVNKVPKDFMIFFNNTEVKARLEIFTENVYPFETSQYLLVDGALRVFICALLEGFKGYLPFIELSIEEEIETPKERVLRRITSVIKDIYTFRRDKIIVEKTGIPVDPTTLAKIISLNSRPEEIYRWFFQDENRFKTRFTEPEVMVNLTYTELQSILAEAFLKAFPQVEYVKKIAGEYLFES